MAIIGEQVDAGALAAHQAGCAGGPTRAAIQHVGARVYAHVRTARVPPAIHRLIQTDGNIDGAAISVYVKLNVWQQEAMSSRMIVSLKAALINITGAVAIAVWQAIAA